jgi:hypothetical protein
MAKYRYLTAYWFLIAVLLLALPVAVAQALTPGSGWDERTVSGADLSQRAIEVRSGYDIDGDGYGEFVVLLAEDGQVGADDVVIFEATGDNSYSKVWGANFDDDSGDAESNGLFVGDSDGDGKVEIVVGRQDPDRILIYEYSGSGQITDGSNPSETPTSLSVSNTVTGIIVTDLDGDGNNEIIAVTIDNDTSLYAFETDGDNSYAAAVTYDVGEHSTPTSYDGCDGVAGVNVDLDGDGTREIAVSGNGDRLYIFTFDGSSWTEEFDSGDLADEGDPIQPGDNHVEVYNLDQDGRPEIIVSNQRDNEIYVFEGTAANTYGRDATDEAINNGSTNMNAIAAGNLVGDSMGEIYYEDATGAISYREFTGSAGSFDTTDFGAEQTLASASETYFFGIGYGNGSSNGTLPSLDGDNYRDIVLVRNSDTGNEIYVLESQTEKPTAIVLSSFIATAHAQPLVPSLAMFAVAAIGLGLLIICRRA